MPAKDYDIMNSVKYDIAWCPGCGNYGIRKVLMETLAELNIKPQDLVISSGIGQAPKMPHYIKTNFFNGLHGREAAVAMAIKATNPKLTVLAVSGDGGAYGEGGNHFTASILRNATVTHIVHNNMIYGLTKGQTSPTSPTGMKTSLHFDGNFMKAFNPIAHAVAQDIAFVARTFIGNQELTKDVLKKAITAKGYALVDIFQPCVTFNHIHTYQWFKEHTYVLDKSYDPTNQVEAFKIALEADKIPLGVIYTNQKRATFEELCGAYAQNKEPLFTREVNLSKLQNLIKTKTTA